MCPYAQTHWRDYVYDNTNTALTNTHKITHIHTITYNTNVKIKLSLAPKAIYKWLLVMLADNTQPNRTIKYDLKESFEQL